MTEHGAPTVGACPSVHRPFPQRDGALVRIRVPGGVLTADHVGVLADAAEAAGAGIEITSRANLQLRGVSPGDVAALGVTLVDAGLASSDGDADARRNVLASPMAGMDPTELIDVTALVGEVAELLAATPAGSDHKFGVTLDGGGTVHLRGRRAPVGLGAVQVGDGSVWFEMVLGAALPLCRDPAEMVWLVPPGRVPDAVAAAGRGSGWSVGGIERIPAGALAGAGATKPSPRPLGVFAQRQSGMCSVGAMPLLGRLDGPTLRQAGRVATIASAPTSATAGATASATAGAGGQLRLTPWRSLLIPWVPAEGAPAALAALAALGFAVDADDPAAGVVACAGATGCPAGMADTLTDARWVIAALREQSDRREAPAVTVHLSGCAKRCASRDDHDLTFIAGPEPGRYHLDAPGGEDAARGNGYLDPSSVLDVVLAGAGETR
ncbi:MAG: hypothetical protein ACYC1D_15090 [Acidimicrobiales bacterium]